MRQGKRPIISSKRWDLILFEWVLHSLAKRGRSLSRYKGSLLLAHFREKVATILKSINSSGGRAADKHFYILEQSWVRILAEDSSKYYDKTFVDNKLTLHSQLQSAQNYYKCPIGPNQFFTHKMETSVLKFWCWYFKI